MMIGSSVTIGTMHGRIELYPGDMFQAIDRKMQSCKFQFLDYRASEDNRRFYLHDETHDKFMDVSGVWFNNRTINLIGGN